MGERWDCVWICILYHSQKHVKILSLNALIQTVKSDPGRKTNNFPYFKKSFASVFTPTFWACCIQDTDAILSREMKMKLCGHIHSFFALVEQWYNHKICERGFHDFYMLNPKIWVDKIPCFRDMWKSLSSRNAVPTPRDRYIIFLL